MSLEVFVPEVSEGVTSGTVISLAVAVGDEVEEDQTLLELETEKAVVAIPSPGAGRVSEIRVAEGDEAQVGAVIMLLEDSGEQGPAEAQESVERNADETPEPAAETEPEQASGEVPTSSAAQNESEAPLPVAEQPTGDQLDEVDLTRVRRGRDVAPAAPSVRRIARELGVDIDRVTGSGPAGRISADDVRAYVRRTLEGLEAGGPGVTPGALAAPELPDFSQWGEVRRESLNKVREVTAAAMAQSWSTIPMVTQYDAAAVDHLEDFRRDYNRSVADQDKLTMTAILLKVCAAALKEFPQFNSSLDVAKNELILKEYIHIGVAVDTPSGLLVPVIRNADCKGIATIAGELNELAARTRERKATPEELTGGSFTISNLGGIGGTAFTPLVYAPQVAILGVSRGTTEPVWNGREFVPRLILPLSLTYDHRVIDGADGARFLRWICAGLENPLKLLMNQ